MMRIVVHIARETDESWVAWQLRDWRQCQMWMLLGKKKAMGTTILMLAGHSWSIMDTNCAPPCAADLH